jgi:hypothetical protein
MTPVEIQDANGRLVGRATPFLQAPAVGDLVAVGRQWAQVIAVFHGWVANAPHITIRIAPPSKALTAPPTADDYVPIP